MDGSKTGLGSRSSSRCHSAASIQSSGHRRWRPASAARYAPRGVAVRSTQTVVVGAEPESEIRGPGVVTEKLTANLPVRDVGRQRCRNAIRARGNPVPQLRIQLTVLLADGGTEERAWADRSQPCIPGLSRVPVVLAAVHAGGRIARRNPDQFMVGKAQGGELEFALLLDGRQFQRQLTPEAPQSEKRAAGGPAATLSCSRRRVVYRHT